MSNNRILIDQSNNTVTTDTTSTQNNVILSPDNPDVVKVVENTSNIITITVPGPKGLTGEQGPQGPSGSIDPNYNTGSFSGSFTGVLIGTASYSPNLYNSDGTLTSNRTITLDDKQLIHQTNYNELPNYTLTLGTPTGVTPSVLPISEVYQGEYNITSKNANPFITRVWVRSQSTSQRFTTINSVYADITAESTGAGRITNQYFQTLRGSSLDVSTAGLNTMIGIQNLVGSNYQVGLGATTTQIYTNQVINTFNQVTSQLGSIGTAYGNFNSVSVSSFTTFQNSTISTYYAYYATAIIGSNSGPIGTITNYYGLFLETPLIRATGTITNRWGVFAPDALMSHSIQGPTTIPNITGSLFGTSSWSNNSLTASSADNFTVRESITGSNALFTGTITAQTLVVQTITSSIDYVTGSIRFGSLLTDTHVFTGSVSITGSLNATASNAISSSYAVTASYALNAGGAGASVAANIFNYYNFT
jgi:hypothetical protein